MHATLVVFIAGAAVALELPPFSGGARALLRVLPPFLVGLGSFGGPTSQPEPPSWSASRACESTRLPPLRRRQKRSTSRDYRLWIEPSCHCRRRRFRCMLRDVQC
jgi:hypothetical protein